MSDLTASNCGCNNTCNNGGFFGGNGCESLIWLILLTSCCGNGGGLFGGNGCGCGDNNNSCCNLIWLILLFSCCGNGFGC